MALNNRCQGGHTGVLMDTDLSEEGLLQRAHALYDAAHAKNLRALIARKIEDLRCYDVPNMERAVAICYWGRSGSLLAASYLDGHDDVVLLPEIGGEGIYQFFECYQSFTLHEKLIAYPIVVGVFFQGAFAINAEDYYAAVAAIFEVYGGSPRQLLETRRAFFQFLHVAYSLALGRRPASTRPLMVYAQHWWNEELARCFVDDFPQGRFLHTVRDPITTFDRTIEFWQQDWAASMWRKSKVDRTSVMVMGGLRRYDRPHSGMESRTRAIRFEDLHNKQEETMRRVLDWLGLPFHVAVLKSTFNGRPYIVERAGIAWTGPRPEQTQRFSRNIAFTDKAILFALFYENFVAWNYFCPKIFGHALVRGLICILVLLIPMKAEIIGARATIKMQVRPSLRLENFQSVFGCLFRIFVCRLSMIWNVAGELCRRIIFGKSVLKLL
jgi:Sulfotransferase family